MTEFSSMTDAELDARFDASMEQLFAHWYTDQNEALRFNDDAATAHAEINKRQAISASQRFGFRSISTSELAKIMAAPVAKSGQRIDLERRDAATGEWAMRHLD